ncbi:hypothetical protein [Paenibacillus arenosi]|uniref:Uncharacterized protein n=1 Tax=Paenibacillus arenosi TaxID=2774142 RepID=A0ABR9B2H6_9BACL|nr:hypothetical protein [Paenibacillus arenosi]MBD8500549.1 hypothetical protein [Paenibacillus arenosi]
MSDKNEKQVVVSERSACPGIVKDKRFFVGRGGLRLRIGNGVPLAVGFGVWESL